MRWTSSSRPSRGRPRLRSSRSATGRRSPLTTPPIRGSCAGGDLLDTIVEVSKGMQKRKPARPVIAVLTMDGSVEFGNRYYVNVLEELEKAGAALHVVS